MAGSERSLNTDAKLNGVLAEFIRRRDQGQTVDVESMCQVYPDLADALRSYAAGEERLLEMAGDSPVESPRDSAETIRPGAAQRTELPENSMLGRYRILRVLGEGAMGTVLLVKDTHLQREVALKLPKITGMDGPEFLQRFAREARAAAQLDHPNICRVYDADVHQGTPFFTMAYIDGLPLSRSIGTQEFKDQRRVAEIIRGIASGLAHAHDKGILHRDLKPGNVLMGSDGVPYVTDFGLARRVKGAEESRITQEGTVLGTPAYMSPEQIQGDPDQVGTASDIYSLGVVMYELLTGRLPFQGSNMLAILGQVLRDRVPRPFKLRADVDSKLEALCLQMLEKTPAKRPESMQAIVKQLDEWLKKGTVSPTPVEKPAPPTDERLEALKATIVSLVQRGQFAVAISKLEQMAKLTTPASAAYVAWAKQKLPEVKALPKQLKASVPALVATAQQCVEKHDYAQAAQLLQAIPEDFRSPECHDLLHQAVELQDECDLLLSDIRECVRKRQFTGIEGNLKRLLKLKPGHTFAQNLLSSLSTYRKTPSGERRYRYDEKGNLLPQGGDGILGSWVRKAVLVGVLVFLITSYFVRDYLRNYLRNSTVGNPQGLGLNPGSLRGDEVPKPVPAAPKPIPPLPSPDDEKRTIAVPKTLTSTTGMDFVRIEPGEFWMGSKDSAEELAKVFTSLGAKVDQFADEYPRHKVRITKPFYLGKYEVTVKQFREFVTDTKYVTVVEKSGGGGGWLPESAATGNGLWTHGPQYSWQNPGFPQGDDHPVVNVSWLDAQEFCKWMSNKERNVYRLPTEAEWEYACRSGNETLFTQGDDIETLRPVANFADASLRQKAPGYPWHDRWDDGIPFTGTVGKLKANAWGLHDMHGNAWEWCADGYEATYYQQFTDSIAVDPTGSSQGKLRVFRGGGWSDLALGQRSAERNMHPPDISTLSLGFRVAAVPAELSGQGVVVAPVAPPSPAPNVVIERWLIPTGETGGHAWDCIMSQKALPKGWIGPNYSGRFSKLKSAYGNRQINGVNYGTSWTTSHIYLRTTVDLPKLDQKRLVLRHIHDDDAWIYVNGKELDLRPANAHAHLWGYSHSYSDLKLTPQQNAIFREGTNTICVHCVQNSLGQVIDIGLKVVDQ